MPHEIDLDAVALIDSVGDAGIGVYTHELAEALAQSGVDVAVYTPPAPFTAALPRHYDLHPYLGVAPSARVSIDGGAPVRSTSDVLPNVSALDPYLDALARIDAQRAVSGRRPGLEAPAVGHGAIELTDALLEEVAGRGATTVWTQWPVRAADPDALRARCHAAGLSLLHTVHNVAPHEPDAALGLAHATTHAAADGLIVHSEAIRRALLRHVPEAAERTHRSWHGLYTIYPDRHAARDHVRARLGACEDTNVVLVFGGVRPYKNVDAIVAAMGQPSARTLVVIAGWEWGYPDLVPDDRLGRTRKLVRLVGAEGRVRLLPGPFGLAQTAELFAAADIVAVPYLESFGSGVLLLAMTYGRHVLATDAGGMGEYLVDYPARTLIADGSVDAVRRGLTGAGEALRTGRRTAEAPDWLRWSNIVAALRNNVSMLRANDVAAR